MNRVKKVKCICNFFVRLDIYIWNVKNGINNRNHRFINVSDINSKISFIEMNLDLIPDDVNMKYADHLYTDIIEMYKDMRDDILIYQEMY